MSGKIFLIIESYDEHRLADMPPSDLTGYRQVSGPFAGMVPFYTVFARKTVGGDRIAEITSSYIGRRSNNSFKPKPLRGSA